MAPHAWMNARVALLVVWLGLTGCEGTMRPVAADAPAQPRIEFLDLQSFDRELSRSFGAPLEQVQVSFHDRTSPNKIPDRVQAWMAAVEEGGGQVKVLSPPAPFESRSPLLILGAITSLWSASKTAAEMAAKAQYRSAGRYDAEIVLKLDKGETVIDRIVFKQRR